jgi:hypothetical protein
LFAYIIRHFNSTSKTEFGRTACGASISIAFDLNDNLKLIFRLLHEDSNSSVVQKLDMLKVLNAKTKAIVKTNKRLLKNLLVAIV